MPLFDLTYNFFLCHYQLNLIKGGITMQFESNKPIILASGSPRRKELFTMLGVPFNVVVSKVVENEKGLSTTSFKRYAENIALEKSEAIAKDYPNAVIIGADTVVGLGTRIFPKPQDNKQAKAFLQELSGQTHSVVTAVVVIVDGTIGTFSSETKVTFYELEDALIDAYIATGDSLDKAGGYGIQTSGGLFVKGIEGDYYAVMGLPIAALARHLQSLNVLSLKGDA